MELVRQSFFDSKSKGDTLGNPAHWDSKSINEVIQYPHCLSRTQLGGRTLIGSERAGHGVMPVSQLAWQLERTTKLDLVTCCPGCHPRSTGESSKAVGFYTGSLIIGRQTKIYDSSTMNATSESTQKGQCTCHTVCWQKRLVTSLHLPFLSCPKAHDVITDHVMTFMRVMSANCNPTPSRRMLLWC